MSAGEMSTMAFLAETSPDTTPATWGISGPTFVGIYTGLVVASLVVMLVLRWRAEPVHPGWRASSVADLSPYEIAMTNGGPDLVAHVVLATLWRRGDLSVRNRVLESTPLLDVAAMKKKGEEVVAASVLTVSEDASPVEPLERDAVDAARAEPGPRPGTVSARLLRAESMLALQRSIEARGLRRSDDVMRRMSRACWVMAPVGALGAVRALAGWANNKPIDNLLLVMGMAFLATLVAFAVDATPAIVRLRLRREVRRERKAAKKMAPWIGQGPVTTQEQRWIGLLGPDVVWTAAPAAALALSIPPTMPLAGLPSGGGGGGGGCGGGGGGGCGGCGG